MRSEESMPYSSPFGFSLAQNIRVKVSLGGVKNTGVPSQTFTPHFFSVFHPTTAASWYTLIPCAQQTAERQS
jgi:hypothetical protein